MAKYYSPSTGQVTNGLPQQPALQTTGGSMSNAIPGGDTSTYDPVTALGVPKSTLERVFAIYGLQNPRSVSSLKGILDMVSPSASETKNRLVAGQAKKDQQQGLQSMDTLWGLYKKMSPLELNLIPYSIAQTFPNFGPNKAAALSHFFLNIEPTIRKTSVGGRATQQEISWFKDALLPRPTDTEQSYRQRWEIARSRFIDRFGNYNASSMDTTPGAPNVNLDTTNQGY